MNFSTTSTMSTEQAVELGVHMLARHLNTNEDIQYEKVSEEDFQKFLVTAIKALSLRIPPAKITTDEVAGALVCPTCGHIHFNRTISVCPQCGQVLKVTRLIQETSVIDYREFRSKLEQYSTNKEGHQI